VACQRMGEAQRAIERSPQKNSSPWLLRPRVVCILSENQPVRPRRRRLCFRVLTVCVRTNSSEGEQSAKRDSASPMTANLDSAMLSISKRSTVVCRALASAIRQGRESLVRPFSILLMCCMPISTASASVSCVSPRARRRSLIRKPIRG